MCRIKWGMEASEYQRTNNTYKSWGHTKPTLLKGIPFNEILFFGRTNSHNRVLLFKTTDVRTLNYARTSVGYIGGNYHWGIRGLGSRWEVDDYPGGAGYHIIQYIEYM